MGFGIGWGCPTSTGVTDVGRWPFDPKGAHRGDGFIPAF